MYIYIYVCISLPRLHHQLAKTIVNIVGSKLSQAYKAEAIHTCVYYLVNHILLLLALFCLMSDTISASRWQQLEAEIEVNLCKLISNLV